MTKLILLFVVFLLALSSDLIPSSKEIMEPDPFMFHDFGKYDDGKQIGIVFKTYSYMITQHLSILAIFFMMAMEEKKYREALWVFFGLNFLDFVDFLLNYNTTWFRFEGIPITMNVVSSVIFGLIILREWIKNLHR